MNNRLRDVPKSRVFTTGFKLFSAFGFVALTAALIEGFQSCKPDIVGWEYPPVVCTGSQGLVDSLLGAVTLGWKGGVGDPFIYTVFVTFAFASLAVAGFLTAFRDADPRSVAEAARTEVAPPINPPAQVSYWPVLMVFSIAFMAIGLVANPATFVAGAVGVGVCGVMWTLRTWAEHATGANTVNEEVRERVAFGLEVPIFACIVVALAAVSISRMLLTASRTEAVVVAGVVSTVFFIAAVAYAYFPRVSRNAIAVFAVCAGAAIVGGAIVSTIAGEREFHPHEEEGHETEAEGEEHGTEGEGGTETESEGEAPAETTETTAVGSN
jgi:hypothetical protein